MAKASPPEPEAAAASSEPPVLAWPAEETFPGVEGQQPGEKDSFITDRLSDPQKHGGVLVAAVAIVDHLLETGLASKRVLTPSQMGVHPCNRSSYGVNEVAVHKLGQNIMDLGFSLAEISNPWCVAEDPEDQYITKVNQAMFANSETIAKCTQPVLAGTLTNGHVTLLLRSILQEVPCEVPSLTLNGKMSLQHVAAQSTAMKDAALHGWEWTMLHAEVRHTYGSELFEFLSDAKNVSINNAETEVQVLWKATQLAISMKKKVGDINWQEVHSKIVQTKPACGDYVHSLIRFVKMYSGGGDNASLMTDFTKFHSKFVSPERVMGGPFFEHLTNFEVKESSKKTAPSFKVPLLLYALLKCQSSCPPSAVVNKECQFVSKSDLDKLAKKNNTACLEAEALLSKSREIILQAQKPVAELDRVRLFGKLDVNVARFLLGKQRGSKHEFRSLGEAAWHFAEEAKPIAGLDANPWADHAPPVPSASGADRPKKADCEMQTYSCTGKHIPADLTSDLAAKGFKVDAIVLPKKNKDKDDTARFVIKKIDKNSVHLKKEKKNEDENKDEDDSTCDIPTIELEAKYTVYKEEHYPYEAFHGKLHEQFIRQSQKSIIASSMFGLSTASLKQGLRLLSKPVKSVLASCRYKAGELIIVPETFAVMHSKTTEELPSNASLVDTSFKLPPGQSYYLAPTTMNTDPAKETLITPFWLVQATTDEEAVNMEKSKMTVHCNTKVDIGKSKWSATFAESSHKIIFEVLRNTKAIDVGEELLLAAPSESSRAPKRVRR